MKKEESMENKSGREETIKKLRQELAEAMEQLEDECSMERIDRLTAQLESLKGEKGEFGGKQAKEEFFRKYYPLAEKREEEKRECRPRRRLRATVVLVVTFLCLNGATVAIGGMNLFEAIFQWDEETFRIGTAEGAMEIPAREDKTTIFSEEGTAWADLEADFGAEIPLIGAFEDMEIKKMKKFQNGIAAIDFSDGKEEYNYSVYRLDYGHTNMMVEKTAEEPIQFVLDGITYYFVENRKWTTIVWQYENQIYTISGDFNEEWAKTIVESIQYEEELQ